MRNADISRWKETIFNASSKMGEKVIFIFRSNSLLNFFDILILIEFCGKERMFHKIFDRPILSRSKFGDLISEIHSVYRMCIPLLAIIRKKKALGSLRLK